MSTEMEAEKEKQLEAAQLEAEHAAEKEAWKQKEASLGQGLKELWKKNKELWHENEQYRKENEYFKTNQRKLWKTVQDLRAEKQQREYQIQKKQDEVETSGDNLIQAYIQLIELKEELRSARSEIIDLKSSKIVSRLMRRGMAVAFDTWREHVHEQRALALYWAINVLGSPVRIL
jgi:chromosome segregation ATPase